MHWQWCRFADLGVDGCTTRCSCAAACSCWSRGPTSTRTASTACPGHLLGRDTAGTLISYLRLVDPGAKYAEPSIGRHHVA